MSVADRSTQSNTVAAVKGSRYGSSVKLRQAATGRGRLPPHRREVGFSERIAEFGELVSHLGVVRCPVGLEVLLGQLLFQLLRDVVPGHFLFVLFRLAESLPGLCELIAAGGVVGIL